MSQLRKIGRDQSKRFSRYGQRAVAMAVSCRGQGLRDLAVPIEQVAECIEDDGLRRRAEQKPQCEERGDFSARVSCHRLAVLLIITDSHLCRFYCEEHAEKRAVRLK